MFKDGCFVDCLGDAWPIDDFDDGWTKRGGEAARRLRIFRHHAEQITPQDIAAIVDGRKPPTGRGKAAVNMARAWMRQIGALPPEKGRKRRVPAEI